MRGADALLRGRIIVVGADLHKAFIIRHRENKLDENGKQSENWTIRALGLKSVIDMRLALPPDDAAYDVIKADAETLMKSYVDHNAITTQAGRKIANLALAPNLNRGETIEWQSRYKRLSDEVIEISELSGVGWNVTLDYVNKRWLFDVAEGRDLRASQSDNPPVIFAPQFDSLRSMEYVTSDLNYRSVAYVAGAGEGVDRRVIEVGEAIGMDRYELFVDARDIAEIKDVDGENVPIPEADVIASLTERGRQKLAENSREEFVSGQVTSGSIQRKRITKITRGLELGDSLNVISTPPGLQLDFKDAYFISQFQPTEEASQGTNVLPVIDLSSLGQYENSKLEWTVNTPVGTAIVVEYSIDGEGWVTLSNGQSLPFIRGEGLAGKELRLRQRFFTNAYDKIPTLQTFSLSINGYQTSHEKVFGVAGQIYEKDFDLGDIVTVQNNDWGVTLDTRITEVTEAYETSGSHLEVTFGNSRPTLFSKIKQEIYGMQTELTR